VIDDELPTGNAKRYADFFAAKSAQRQRARRRACAVEVGQCPIKVMQ